MTTAYLPVLKDLKKILKKHIPILHINPRMVEVFKEPPMAAIGRGGANHIGKSFARCGL